MNILDPAYTQEPEEVDSHNHVVHRRDAGHLRHVFPAHSFLLEARRPSVAVVQQAGGYENDSESNSPIPSERQAPLTSD